MATTATFIEPGTDATQDLTFFASTNGTVASDTAHPYTGTRSIKLTQTGLANTNVITPTGAVVDSGSQFSSYWYFDTLAAASATAFISVQQAGGSSVFTIQMASTGILTVQPTGGTPASGTTVIAVNTFYRISVAYYITNTTTFQIRLYLNGVLEATANAGTLTRTTSSRVSFGPSSTYWGSGTVNIWLDNIYVATGGASSAAQPDTGNILVTAKRPNANGTTNGFTTQIGSGGSGYGSGHSPQVNEQPLSTTNGWSMVGAGSAVTEEYNVESASVGDVNISGCPIVDWCGWIYASTLVSETGQIVVGGATSNVALTSTNTMFKAFKGSTTYPAGTGTDIGIVTDTTVTTVSLYECGVLVAYIQAFPAWAEGGVFPAMVPQGPNRVVGYGHA